MSPPPDEPPPLTLFAEFSKPSPPIRMSRPKPIIVLQELKSTTVAAIIKRCNGFIGAFDS